MAEGGDKKSRGERLEGLLTCPVFYDAPALVAVQVLQQS